MSTWTLLILIGLAWLSYPLGGAASVAADACDGRRPKGAGFSFFPELIVFPAAFFGLAALIDSIAMPWGRRVVGGICILMLASQMYLFVRGMSKVVRQRSLPPNLTRQRRPAMIALDHQSDILHRLQEVHRLCPEMRLGQLLATIGMLGEGSTGDGLWEIEDAELSAAVERFASVLRRRIDD